MLLRHNRHKTGRWLSILSYVDQILEAGTNGRTVDLVPRNEERKKERKKEEEEEEEEEEEDKKDKDNNTAKQFNLKPA